MPTFLKCPLTGLKCQNFQRAISEEIYFGFFFSFCVCVEWGGGRVVNQVVYSSSVSACQVSRQ